MKDKTEEIRRELVNQINANPSERELLEKGTWRSSLEHRRAFQRLHCPWLHGSHDCRHQKI